MIKRILDKRLERHFRNPVGIQRRVDRNLVGKQIAVTVPLDLQIAQDVLFLLPHRDNLPSAAEHQLEESRERHDHILGIVVLSALDQPDNRIERIVEEMRVDLLLEEPKLLPPQPPLVLLDLADHDVQMPGHVVDRIRERRDLILSALVRCPGLKIPLRDPGRHLHELLQRSCDAPDDVRAPRQDRKNQSRQQNAGKHHHVPDGDIESFLQPLDAPCLIVDVILDVILDQLGQDIDVVVEHVQVFLIAAALRQAVFDIVQPLLQCVDIAQQAAEPLPALAVCRDALKTLEIMSQFIDLGIRIRHRAVILKRLFHRKPPDHQSGNRQVRDNLIIRPGIAVQRDQKVDGHRCQRYADQQKQACQPFPDPVLARCLLCSPCSFHRSAPSMQEAFSIPGTASVLPSSATAASLHGKTLFSPGSGLSGLSALPPLPGKCLCHQAKRILPCSFPHLVPASLIVMLLYRYLSPVAAAKVDESDGIVIRTGRRAGIPRRRQTKRGVCLPRAANRHLLRCLSADCCICLKRLAANPYQLMLGLVAVGHISPFHHVRSSRDIRNPRGYQPCCQRLHRRDRLPALSQNIQKPSECVIAHPGAPFSIASVLHRALSVTT